ncbi:MAG: TetR/AcrR family transcriptional regulator [Bauldia sp.]
MKVSKETAAANRAALLSASGTLYRQKGFASVTIAEVGAAAGLTHGALYGHFRSKEALLLATVGSLFDWTAEQVQEAPGVGAFLDLYLSRRHVDNPGAGCPLAALGDDTARADRRVKADFARGLERLIEAFSELAGTSGGESSRAATVSAIAAMVGAVVLARATGDKKLGAEILETVRAGLARSVEGHRP